MFASIVKQLRKYKAAYMLYNVFNYGKLKHNIPLYKKYGLDKFYFSPISSSDFRNLDSPLNKYDQLDSAVHMPEDERFKKLDLNPASQESLLKWSDHGYAILPGFYSEEEVDAFNQEIDRLQSEDKINFKYGNKLMFAIHKSPLLMSAGKNAKLLDILGLLLDGEARLFQSINFITGSQQKSHSDHIHMTTYPFGNLIAAWVALEDIGPDCGPLHYYPGSHKLPYVFNEHMDNEGTYFKLGDKTYEDYESVINTLIKDKGLHKEVFLARKGDILIWHANLLHGGEKVNKPNSTRKSMVFHYYAKDVICFHEVTQRPTLMS